MANRPPAAWTAALLFCCGGTARLLLLVFPLNPNQPDALIAAIGLSMLLIGVTLWVFAWRVPMAVLQGLMYTSALLVSVLVANAKTDRGALLAAFSYPWIMVYTAHFFSRRTSVALACVISASFGVAYALNGLPGGLPDWLFVSAAVFATGVILGDLGESLRRQADTDYLTGLLNRNGFLAAATRERAVADRSGQPLTLAVLDLDGFKKINDHDGHAAGDRLLATLGRDWRSCVRSGDILARHGGDEFVLLMPCTAPGGAAAVLARMRTRQDAVCWSCGVSEWLEGESLDAALARADRHLYRAKAKQRVELAALASETSAPRPAHALLPSI
ncbi:MAG TPA: GGDEF domain-containing protein [Solirubrobacteraceae bacterium]|nr:GGDEF domain-containing protein [Solirubrobacteraceae bacterium]